MKSRWSAFGALSFLLLLVATWESTSANARAARLPPQSFTNREPLWTFDDAKGAIVATPALSPDGLTLYVGSADRHFYAIDTATGTSKWTNSLRLPAPVLSSPVINDDGVIYVGCANGFLYAITDQGDGGQIEFHSFLGGKVNSSPAVDDDGIIYSGTTGNHLIALFSDGAKKWVFNTSNNVSAPVIASNGTIYMISGGFLRGVSPEGEEVSSFTPRSAIHSLPAVGIDDTLYFGANDERVYALEPGGTTNDVRWRFDTGKNILSSPAIGADGRIYIGSDTARVYCFTTNGALRWSVPLRAPVRSALSIGVDGTIYVGCDDKRLYAISSDGRIQWAVKTRAPVRSSAVIDAFGVVYFSSGRLVYAVETEAAADDSDEQTWPMFRKDRMHTARATECRPFLIQEPQVSGGATSTNIPAGSSITLSVVVRAGAPVTFRWRLNGVEIDPAENRSATNTTFTITNISALDAGDFTVHAFNDCGEVESDIFTLNVDSPPVIISQPTNVFTLAGNTVTLHVGAIGTPPLTYQWKRDGVPIDPTFNPTATNATLVISNAQPSDSSSNYSVMVMNRVMEVPHVVSSTSVVVQVFAVTLGLAEHPLGAGQAHSLAVLSDRTLWSWGLNNFGQLGDGNSGATGANFVFQNVPRLIGTNGTVSTNAVWRSVSGGSRGYDPATNQPGGFSLGIQTNGSLWAWGLNDRGQLGIDSTNVQRLPVRVGADTNWIQAEAGAAHTIALKRDGSIWTWGANDAGQLGIGSTNRQSTVPVRVGTDSAWVEVRAGGHFSLARRADGTIWAWGTNAHGQLGIAASTGSNSVRRVPVMVGTNSNWLAISAGAFHSLGLQSNGTLWSWGRNNFGQLGLGTGAADGREGVNENVPRQIGSAANWSAIEAGNFHSFAINASGTLFAWGANFFGQLGNGEMGSTSSTNDANRISPVSVATDKTWKFVDASSHSLGMTTDGSIWAWGLNNFGQVGDGTGGDGSRNNNRSIPVLLSFNANTNVGTTNPAVITQHPASQDVNESAKVTFTVGAIGTPPLAYQWYFNSNAISPSANPSAATENLSITNAQSANSGFYHAVVTNNFGQVTSAVARLTVTTTSGAPQIVQQPMSRSAISNSSSGFSVSVEGASPLSYRWRFNSNPMDPSRAVVTNSTLLLTNVTGADQGFYDVIVTNRFGSVTSAPAQLTVTASPFLASPTTDKASGREVQLGVIKLTDRGAEISVAGTQVGQNIVLEFKNTLDDPAWMPLSTNKGPVTILVDPMLSPGRSRLYRVRVE